MRRVLVVGLRDNTDPEVIKPMVANFKAHGIDVVFITCVTSLAVVEVDDPPKPPVTEWAGMP
jgi:hypothetical protein